MKHTNTRFLFIVLGFLLLPFTALMALENIQVGTSTRTMIVYAPTNISTNRPLIINMHGYNQDAGFQKNAAKWENIADTAQFIVAFPNGINKSWDISGTNDVNFITTIIDTMYNRYQIDRNRVYLSGFSMGGMMTYHAASRIADKIAAFAPVSGYMLSGSTFNSSRPVPIIHIHGTADDVVTYNNNLFNYLEGWVSRNNCSENYIKTQPYPTSKTNSIATKYLWDNGDENTKIVLITQEGKGHWWSLDIANGINTSEEVWNFCKQFSLNPGAPTVNITSPTSDSEFSTYNTIQISATATDEDGSIASVAFYANDSLLNTDTEAPYSFEWSNASLGHYAIKAVATDNENKTSEASISITVSAPKAPALKSAIPEDKSFNLSTSINTFKFAYDKSVDCSKAKAEMSNGSSTFDLTLLETDFSDTLTFTLPSEASITKGEYSITISDLISEYAAEAEDNDVVTYLFGELEESIIDTVFTDGWNNSNIIPSGWKISYNSNVRKQGEKYTLGPRVLQFQTGGDFEYGIYLRDEGDVCHAAYGSYDDNRLVLDPGDYYLSFYYSWWNSGAENNKLNISMTVLDALENPVFEQEAISTTHGFNSFTNVVPLCSQLCEYKFSITKEQPYILQWNTANFGWNGGIIGGIKLIKIQSLSELANMYSTKYNMAISTANGIMEETDSSIYDGTEKTALIDIINNNTGVAFTSPNDYQTAIDNLHSATNSLIKHKWNIDYLSALNSANNVLIDYNNTQYTTEDHYVTLSNYINDYSNVESSDISTLQVAYNNLYTYAALVPNWLEIAIPALTFRLEKAIALSSLLGENETFIEQADTTFTDNDDLVNNINYWNTLTLHNLLSLDSIRFGNSQENPKLIDSLDMTGYIKNPNFYTTQTTNGINNSTFSGWTIGSDVSEDAGGPDALPTENNPVINTDVKAFNVAINHFEQTITGLPIGIYNVYMNTRLPAEITNDDAFIFYAIATGTDTIKTNFSSGNYNDRISTGLKNIEVIDSTLTIGIKASVINGYTPTIRWGDPTLWMVDIINGYQYPYTGIKQMMPEHASIKEIRYYTLEGYHVTKLTNGIYIKQTIYSNGSVNVEKIMKYKR